MPYALPEPLPPARLQAYISGGLRFDNTSVMVDGWNLDVVNTSDLTTRFLPALDLGLPMSR